MLDCEEEPFLQHTTQIVGANVSLAVSYDANSDQQQNLNYTSQASNIQFKQGPWQVEYVYISSSVHFNEAEKS